MVKYKNGLISLFSKLLTSQPDKQTIEIHVMHNFSKSKGKQTMKVGQLTEYNMRNIFIEYKNFAQNMVEKLLLDTFLKKSKFNISLDK